MIIAKDKPDCTSCHVQHIKDKRHWNPALMASVSDAKQDQDLNQK